MHDYDLRGYALHGHECNSHGCARGHECIRHEHVPRGYVRHERGRAGVRGHGYTDYVRRDRDVRDCEFHLLFLRMQQKGKLHIGKQLSL